MYHWMGKPNSNKKKSIFISHYVRFTLKLKKVACLVQDVVSPYCGDKRMVRR